MRLRVVLCSIFTLIAIEDARSQWTDVSGIMAGDRVTDIWFTDNETGFAVADSNTLYTTTNAGETWQKRKVTDCDTCRYNFSKIQLFDKLTGYIWDYLPSNTFKTTDGGASWMKLDSAVPHAQYFSETYGVRYRLETVGSDYYRTIYVTRDMGKTWEEVLNEFAEDGLPQMYLAMSDPTNGILQKTPWKYQHLNVTTLTDLASPPALPIPIASKIWLSITQTGMMRSDDGGITWNKISSETGIRQVKGISSSIVYAVRATDPLVISASSDGGATWGDHDVITGASEIRVLRAGELNAALGFAFLLTDWGQVFRTSWAKSDVRAENIAKSLRITSPHPVANELTIESSASISELSISDITGATVMRLDPAVQIHDVSALSSGVYAIEARLDDGSIQRLVFVKE
jgi:photosystem II stability/assembly factor-like uncharacterized protein